MKMQGFITARAAAEGLQNFGVSVYFLDTNIGRLNNILNRSELDTKQSGSRCAIVSNGFIVSHTLEGRFKVTDRAEDSLTVNDLIYRPNETTVFLRLMENKAKASVVTENKSATVETDNDSLELLTVKQLRQIAKEKGIANIGKLPKAAIITKIEGLESE